MRQIMKADYALLFSAHIRLQAGIIAHGFDPGLNQVHLFAVTAPSWMPGRMMSESK